jgi:quercetin dioxygenase-like cupin family protein
MKRTEIDLMQIKRDDVGSPGNVDTFTGAVNVRRIHVADESEMPDLSLVEFVDGAVSHLHSHPGGQYLFVSEGTGRVGGDGESEQTLDSGSVVIAGAGEIHWHGAASSCDAKIVAVTWGGTLWLHDADGDQSESV